MPSSRRWEILSQTVVAVLSSLIICSIMFVIVQVQFGEILARQDERIKELTVAIAEAKACCRMKEPATSVSPFPIPAVYQHAEMPVHQITNRQKRHHQDNTHRQSTRDLRRKVSVLQHKYNNILTMMTSPTAIFQITAESQMNNDNNYTVRWQAENAEICDSDGDPTLMPEEDLVHYGRILGIQAKKPGYYSVYAQVKFNGFKRSRGRPGLPYQTYHIMNRPGGRDKNVILLEKTITQAVPDRSNLGDIQAIDMAYSRKVFFLNTNDVVYLRIRWKMSQVKFDKDTYLGLVYHGDKRDD